MPFKNQRSPSAPIVYGDVSIDPGDGSITGTSGNFERISLGGDDLGDLIGDFDLKPTGTVQLFRIYGTSPVLYQQRQTLFKTTRTFSGVRDYTMTTPTLRVNFQDSKSYSDFMNRYVELQVNAQSSNSSHANWTQIIYAYSVAAGARAHLIPSSTFEIVKTHLAADPTITFTATIRTSTAGDPWSVTVPAEGSFIITDLGSITGRRYNDFNLASLTNSGSIPTPPDPEPTPTTQDYVGDWYATHYATYSLNSGENQTSDAPGLIRQSTAVTPRIGMVRFGGADKYGRTLANLRPSNVTIKSVTAYIGAAADGKTVRWYYSAGGIGRLFRHNATSFPSSGIPGRTFLTEIPNWKNNQEKSVNLNSLISTINAGQFQGLALSGEGRSGQYTYHGELPYRMRLRIAYSVTV